MAEKNVRVTAARHRRVKRLSAAVMEWMQLANRSSYPRSLHDILGSALEREYQLGRKRAKDRP